MPAMSPNCSGCLLPSSSQRRASPRMLERGTSAPADDKRDDKQHQEDKEQNLGDTHSSARDAKESQCTSNQRDDKKDNCIVEHVTSPDIRYGRPIAMECGGLSDRDLLVDCRDSS